MRSKQHFLTALLICLGTIGVAALYTKLRPGAGAGIVVGVTVGMALCVVVYFYVMPLRTSRPSGD